MKYLWGDAPRLPGLCDGWRVDYCDQIRISLYESIKSAVTELSAEEYRQEIDAAAKVAWLSTLVQNEELATMWLEILVTTGFSSDLLLNMSNFDWPNYKRLKLMTNLVIG